MTNKEEWRKAERSLFDCIRISLDELVESKEISEERRQSYLNSGNVAYFSQFE